MIGNAIKQLLRMPIKSLSFLVLLMTCSMLLSVSGNLWLLNRETARRYEENFTTIGTIEQKPSATVQNEQWDAKKKDYDIYEGFAYGEILPVSLMDFEGAEYIYPPEKRGHYGSYMPEYEIGLEPADFQDFVVEVTPVEDCIPDHPVEVKVEKVHMGTLVKEGGNIKICNHYEKDPQPLYRGKTYIIYCAMHIFPGEKQEWEEEYVTLPIINSFQYREDGRAVKNEFKAEAYYEMEKGFCETEIGGRWKAFIETRERMEKTIPVTATGSVSLLMPFFSGDTFVVKGRSILEEEYLAGDKVCLISKEFAEMNQLLPGDSLRLQLHYLDYGESAARLYGKQGMSLRNYLTALNVDGETYPVFEDEMYKVVGIYENAPGSVEGEYGIGWNEVIIPSQSMEHKAKNNIVNNGPMKGSTTSFQIPNGRIEHFMEEWNKQGIEELEIRFYDKGYSKVKDGLDNMKRMSMMFLAAGGILTLFILVFFSHLFIGTQKIRTAIERSMGMAKRHCAISLISGVLVILIFGSTAGSMVGGRVSENFSQKSFQDVIWYDLDYTINQIEAGKQGEEEEIRGGENILLVSLVTVVVMLVVGGMILMYRVKKNLQLEPLEMLCGQKE